MKTYDAMTTQHTETAYGDLQFAYNYFNEHLFANSLPQCLITLRKHKGAYGYYHAQNFSLNKNAVDEISLNPAHFLERSVSEVLSTLVHEMVHLKQQHKGTPPKSAYHNREWAEMMKAIGLYPSSTGKEGGKETGARVSHYIVKQGVFDLACGNLLANRTINLYNERNTPSSEKTRSRKAASKTKYTCPECDLNAWAKPDISLKCGDCNSTMQCE